MDKILIVDGSVQNTGLIGNILSSAGYEVYTSESGLNALAKIQLFRPDILMMDVELPDISGYDICKKVKAGQMGPYILVLLVSTEETNESRMRSIEVGADDFLEKTFDSHILLSKVKSLLRVKHLSDQLRQKYVELEEKNNLLDYQLKMGRQVQSSLIKELDMSVNNLRFVSRYMPAFDIGGDFYDVIRLNENCVSVVMGDVSGHGIAAALLTAMLSMMIKNLTAKYFNPDQLLFYMNNEFVKIFEGSAHEMYACVFYAVIDSGEHKIYYSNAGQALPVFVDASNGKAFELESVGLPIGLIKNSTYEYKVIKYNEGDMLLFLTDGLGDSFYKNNPAEFIRRLTEMLLEMRTVDEPAETLEVILNTFYNYNASETEKLEMDDVSLILCRMQ